MAEPVGSANRVKSNSRIETTYMTSNMTPLETVTSHELN